jgi:type I restriction enzyme S subunit
MSKNNWPTKKLGEIAEIYSGGRERITKQDYVEKGFPAFSATGQDGFTKEAHDSGFAVILSSIGSRCGKCFYAEGKWTALANTQIIKFENPITARFMYYYLNDEKKWPKSGTGQPFISPSNVKNLIVPFPPLPIQQKIVKILDTIQEAVDIYDKIIEKTKELKKSLMADLFKYGAPSFRRGRKLKKTEIGEIPEDWGVVRLGKVLKLSSGKSRPSQISNNQTEKMPYPVYGGNGIIGYSDKFIITHPTIVIGRVGEYCGAVYKTQNFAWITDNALYATDIELQKIDLDFSVHYFNYLNLNKFKKKSGQPLLTQTIIYSISLPLPPLSEQQEIAEILQTIDQKIEIEKRKKELYEELFKTMLNKIINQEVEVENFEV